MDSIDEKLQHFTEVVIKEAVKRRDHLVSQMQEEKRAIMAKNKVELEKEAEKLFTEETKRIVKVKNDIIAKAYAESRHILSETRNSIIKAAMDELSSRISSFIASDKYTAYFCVSVKKAVEQAGNGELVLYISKRDADRFPDIASICEIKQKIAVAPSEEDILGGCIVVNRTKNIIINNTIISGLEHADESLFKIGCLKIDS